MARPTTTARGPRGYFSRSGTTWSQSAAKLTGVGATGSPSFGYSVALSAFGDIALIGGPDDNSGAGSAWVFTRFGSTWSFQTTLTGSGRAGASFFGDSVALSGDGSTALVGGSDDNNFAGAAWVFTGSGSSWSQQGPKLTGSGAAGTGSFGFDVALSSDGDRAVIGGPFDGATGAAWVFERAGTTWAQQGSKLTGSGAAGSSAFGLSVAISASGSFTTVLVGGPDDNDSAGAAWLFGGPPIAPGGVTADAGFRQATVSFVGPTEGPVSSYTVFAAPGGASATGTASPLVVTDLTPGTSYTFTVRAANDSGPGPPSAPSNAVTPFDLPGAPTGVLATGGDGLAVVAFTPPASDGSAPIVRYTATASPGGQSASGPAARSGSSG